MALADLLSLTIALTTKTPSQLGFGVALLAAYHTKNTDRVREYRSVAELEADGFAAADAVHKAVSAVFRQNPRVKKIKLGRRANAPVQTWKITPTALTQGTILSFTVDGVPVTYTVGNTETAATISTAIVALIDALTATLAIDGTTVSTTHFTITNTGATGRLHFVSNVSAGLQVEDITADPGLAADLDAIQLADPDWYGLLLDSNSEAEVAVAAGWCESKIKLLAMASSDTTIPSAGVTTDVISDLKTADRARTVPLYHHALEEYPAAAWVGLMLSKKPGSATWANKALAGITTTAVTSTQIAALKGKRCNWYEGIKSIGFTLTGVTSAGEWVDVTIGVDWLRDRIEVRWVAALAQADKIPYTDEGVDVPRGVLLAAMQEGIRAGVLAPTPAPFVDAPLIADVEEADRAARVLPDVTFSARLAGAIHDLDVTGSIGS